MKNKLLLTIILMNTLSLLASDNATQTDESSLMASGSSSSDKSFADVMKSFNNSHGGEEEYAETMTELARQWKINPNELIHPSHRNRTPLEKAVENDDVPFARLLLEHGADANSKIKKPNSHGKTKCHILHQCDNLNMLDLFFRFGARFDTPTDKRLKSNWVKNPAQLSLVIKMGANVESLGNKGYTALHAIARDGYRCRDDQNNLLLSMSILLRHGASITTLTKHGRFKNYNAPMFVKRHLDSIDDNDDEHSQEKFMLEEMRNLMKDSYAKSHPHNNYNDLENLPAHTLDIDSASSSDNNSASDSDSDSDSDDNN